LTRSLLAGTVLWVVPTVGVVWRLDQIGSKLDAAERATLRGVIKSIPPEAVVLADLPFTAMLSGRAALFTYTDPLSMREYDDLGEEQDQWIVAGRDFTKAETPIGQILRKMGFEEMYQGAGTAVLYRSAHRHE